MDDLSELIDAVRIDPDLSPEDVAILVGAQRRMVPNRASAQDILTDEVVRALRASAPERYDELAEEHGWPGFGGIAR